MDAMKKVFADLAAERQQRFALAKRVALQHSGVERVRIYLMMIPRCKWTVQHIADELSVSAGTVRRAMKHVDTTGWGDGWHSVYATGDREVLS